jgi:HlyD family secretion protein
MNTVHLQILNFLRQHAPAVALGGVAVALLALGLQARADKPAAPAVAKPALTVTVTQAQPTALAQTVQANGTVAAWQEAIIGAEANGLRLVEVRVGVGDLVRKGQVLATFASDLLQAEQAQTQAALAEAEATLADAMANAQRARDLAASGALSAQQINQYLTQEQTAQARVQAQRATAKLQLLRLAQARVLASDDGIISARSATVGAVVPAGFELFRLIRQGRLEWRAEVPAADLARLALGQRVRVQPVGGAPLVGGVRMVAPTVDAQSRNGLVYVDLPNAGSAKAGMFARGDFELGNSNALTLPQSAVLQREGFTYVFAVGAGDRVAQTKVQVGQRAGERIEITSGLAPGARVVASGGGFLVDGDTVRVVAAVPSAAPTAAPVPAPVAAPAAPPAPVVNPPAAPTAAKKAAP